MKRKPMKPFTAWAVYDQSGRYMADTDDVCIGVSEAHAKKVACQNDFPQGDWHVCRVEVREKK